MTEFVRVRAKKGPAHEYDAPLLDVRRRPEAFVVLDKTPVTSPRPIKYVVAQSARSAEKPERATKKSKGEGR